MELWNKKMILKKLTIIQFFRLNLIFG